jgi:hypothetical protein
LFSLKLTHAIGLLSILKSPAALPALVDLFQRYDNETLEGLPRALTPFGAQVVEPMLAVVRNPALRWYTRAVATNIAIDTARDDPAQLAHVTATLRAVMVFATVSAAPPTAKNYRAHFLPFFANNVSDFLPVSHGGTRPTTPTLAPQPWSPPAD